MGQPYVGEIRIFGGNFAPLDWKFCDGQILAISEYETLFQLIGTSYGGDGETTFGLPDLRGRVPIHYSNLLGLGVAGGMESVTLSPTQMPAHNHAAGCKNGNGNNTNPLSAVPATNPTAMAYGSTEPQNHFNGGAISNVGGNQAHDNMQPFLCLSFIISLYGIFPSYT